MSRMNFSIPNEVKRRFNETFAHRNKSEVIAELMEQAVEQEQRKGRLPRRRQFAGASSTSPGGRRRRGAPGARRAARMSLVVDSRMDCFVASAPLNDKKVVNEPKTDD